MSEYILLDGKKTAKEIRAEISEEVAKLKIDKTPHLVVVLVGNDGGSMSYVAGKIKACEQVGIKSTLITYEDTVTEITLSEKIKELNEDKNVNGYIIQLPLPKHINAQKILKLIDVDKDVDGFHPTNLGKMMIGDDCFIPATPYGILNLLDRNKISTKGKKVVVIGRSSIVGRPISILLSSRPYDATVTVLHSKSANIAKECQEADILISAVGVPKFVKDTMVKDDVVVIDVGTTRVASPDTAKGFKICGDVDFDNVKKKASYITPVPGGVGPLTITMLIQNTLKAFKNQNNI